MYGLSLILFVLFLPSSNGLQCIQCLDGRVNIPLIPDILRQQVIEKERQFRTPGCRNATSGIVDTNITVSECTNDPGYRNINKCGSLTGTLQLIAYGTINIDIEIIKRGCFGVNPNTGTVCLTDQDTIKEQRDTVESEFGTKIQPLQIGSLNGGQLCIVGTSGSTGLHFVWLLLMMPTFIAITLQHQ